MLLYCSDLHADEQAWAWVKTATLSGKYSAFLFGGDALASNAKMPIAEQVARRRQLFAELTIPAYVVTGNHDWDGTGAPDIGEGYWIHDLAKKHDHIHTHGLHALPGGWVVNVVDYLEPVFLEGEGVGPGTILMQHVPPSGPCSWSNGVNWGDDMLRDDLLVAGSSPALVCSGHTHLPKAHAHRQGRNKTLCLNPGVSPSGGRPNHFEICTEQESVRFVSGDGRDQEFVMPIYPR